MAFNLKRRKISSKDHLDWSIEKEMKSNGRRTGVEQQQQQERKKQTITRQILVRNHWNNDDDDLNFDEKKMI